MSEYYKPVALHFPSYIHDKINSGRYEDHIAVHHLHDYFSENVGLGADWMNSLEEAKRIARWNEGHTDEEGKPATAVVVHSDDRYGRNITGYSWSPHHDSQWHTRELTNQKTSMLDFFKMADMPGQEELFPSPKKQTPKEPEYKKHYPNPESHREEPGWNAPAGKPREELKKWCPTCQDHHSEEEAEERHDANAPECHKEFGCEEHREDPGHSMDDHWCDNHEEHHESAWDAAEHNQHETHHWEHTLDTIKTMHRGMAVHLPNEVHNRVHGIAPEEDGESEGHAEKRKSSAPSNEHVAHELMNHFEGKNLGMHWSSDLSTSKSFARGLAKHKSSHNAEHSTEVIFHAHPPAHEDVETDGWKLQEHSVFPHDSHESEIPMQHNGEVRVHGVSWRHSKDKEWRHHSFEEEQHHKANKTTSNRSYAVANVHFPEDVHNKIHRGEHGSHQIASLVHQHAFKRDYKDAVKFDSLESAQRAARWNSGHTDADGAPSTAVVAHFDGDDINGYSWLASHAQDWTSHDLPGYSQKSGSIKRTAEYHLFEAETKKTPDVELGEKLHLFVQNPHGPDHSHLTYRDRQDLSQKVCNQKFNCHGYNHTPRDHWCNNHQTYHANTSYEASSKGESKLESGVFHASRHNRAHTDWDFVHSALDRHGDGSVHRGISMKLPDDLHEQVHGVNHVDTHFQYTVGTSAARSAWEEQRENHRSSEDYHKNTAKALVNHFKNTNLGMHWSSDQDVAENFSDGNKHTVPHKTDELRKEIRAHPTQVMFHAHLPEKDHIEKDGWELAKHGVFSHNNRDMEEYEVPIKRNSPMKIHSVSWKHPEDRTWQTHRLDEDSHHTAKKYIAQTEVEKIDSLLPKTGAMIALHPPQGSLDHLLPPRNPQKPEDLHLTLVCLEDGHEPGHMQELPELVREWAESQSKPDLKVGGVGTFVNEDKHVLWASVDHPDLHRLHESLAMYLEEHGYNLKTDNGFTPHITLGFGNTHFRFLPKLDSPIKFSPDCVSVHLGDQDNPGEVHDIPLPEVDSDQR